MRVFDAAPLVSVLLGEPGATTIAASLDEDLPSCRVSAVNYAEVIDRVARYTTTTAANVADVVDWWIAGGMGIDPVDMDAARTAAALRSEHYHRVRCPISLADCHAIALALMHRAELATSDRALIRVAKSVGLTVLILPDSTGSRPKA